MKTIDAKAREAAYSAPRGATDAETCALNGWGPGTRLAGSEGGGGETVIEITAVGKREVLAQRVSHRGVPSQRPSESIWTFVYRDWRVVS